LGSHHRSKKISGSDVVLCGENPKKNIGTLVVISMNRDSSNENIIPGWLSFPGEYGFHKKVFLGPDIGILLDHKDTFYHLLINDRKVWIEFYWIRRLS
jgi:hypothetical protein